MDTKIHVIENIERGKKILKIAKVEGLYNDDMHECVNDFLRTYKVPPKYSKCEELRFNVFQSYETDTGYYSIEMHLQEGVVW